jgi:hypothetical protein
LVVTLIVYAVLHQNMFTLAEEQRSAEKKTRAEEQEEREKRRDAGLPSDANVSGVSQLLAAILNSRVFGSHLEILKAYEALWLPDADNKAMSWILCACHVVGAS